MVLVPPVDHREDELALGSWEFVDNDGKSLLDKLALVFEYMVIKLGWEGF